MQLNLNVAGEHKATAADLASWRERVAHHLCDCRLLSALALVLPIIRPARQTSPGGLHGAPQYGVARSSPSSVNQSKCHSVVNARFSSPA